ncbi:MAG: Na(+)-translocating NADH-quinone reductase subunit C [Pseudomonadota bacterium]
MSDVQPTAPKGPIGRFLALPPDSTPKTIFVAVALCLFCSMIVSVAAVSLRPVQDANSLVDKRKNILQVAGIYEDGINVNEAFGAFEQRILEVSTGEFSDEISVEGFDDIQSASDPELSRELTNDIAGIGRQPNFVTAYLLKDEAGELDKVVLPLWGYGLWSTLYGFVAIEEDGNEIYGLQFYDHGETPGLGAEVDNPNWKSQWQGKKLTDSTGELRITVAKGNPSADMIDHHIDALAGATLTSVGVDNLVKFWMGEQGYAPFLVKLQQGGL